jgi:tRNA-dihydrouridine synthase B
MQKPITLKPHTGAPDKPRLIMAPFKGLTTKDFRNTHALYFGGLDEHLAPFVSGTGTRSISPAKLKDVIPLKENRCLTIPQIISTSAEEIVLFGKTLKDHGYDHINWNLGCPFPRIANKRRGCGMLPFPGEIDRILEKVYSGIPLSMSVKTRLGFYHPQEIMEVFAVLNRYPLREITIHPRIGTQVYRGEVDLQGFAACLETSRHPIIYNGDVYNLRQYHRLKGMFPAITAWMLGRGLLMNPFLALEIKGIEVAEAEKRKRMLDFHLAFLPDGNTSASDKKKRLGCIKNIWYYMAGCFADGEKVFAEIKTTNDWGAYQSLLPGLISGPLADDDQVEAYFRHAIKHIGRDPAGNASVQDQ